MAYNQYAQKNLMVKPSLVSGATNGAQLLLPRIKFPVTLAVLERGIFSFILFYLYGCLHSIKAYYCYIGIDNLLLMHNSG